MWQCTFTNNKVFRHGHVQDVTYTKLRNFSIRILYKLRIHIVETCSYSVPRSLPDQRRSEDGVVVYVVGHSVHSESITWSTAARMSFLLSPFIYGRQYHVRYPAATLLGLQWRRGISYPCCKMLFRVYL